MKSKHHENKHSSMTLQKCNFRSKTSASLDVGPLWCLILVYYITNLVYYITNIYNSSSG